MNIAVRYQSRGGNTKAVAEVIAAQVGTAAEPLSVPLAEPVDILFIGGGTYGFEIDDALKSYLAALEPSGVKAAAVFTTSGWFDISSKAAKAVKVRGIAVSGRLDVRFGKRNFSGKNGDTELSDAQREKVSEFVKKVTA